MPECVDFGVTFKPRKMNKNNTITEQFLSTTKRTVGVKLDLNLGQISFWLNSRMLKKNKTKELKKPGLTWYPYIRLQEPNIPAILNPFCRLPMADTEKPKFRRKLPQSLTNHNLNHGRIQYLKKHLENHYLLLQLPGVVDEQLSKHITGICNAIDIESVNLFKQVGGAAEAQDSKRAALLKFSNQSTAQKWMHAAALTKKEIHLLDSEIIAKMLLFGYLQA